jgi:hypothetical protein
MQNDVSDEPAPQKCHICEAPMVLVSHPGGDGHLSDAAHLQMHGLQVRHGGDGQDALIPIDGFGDYAVARNAVIASKLGRAARDYKYLAVDWSRGFGPSTRQLRLPSPRISLHSSGNLKRRNSHSVVVPARRALRAFQIAADSLEQIAALASEWS